MIQDRDYAVLTKKDRYTIFSYNGQSITFLHGKDLLQYLSVVEWDHGYLVVQCLGKEKGTYEDYIDLPYILENLYMDPAEYLGGIQEVRIANDERTLSGDV